MDIDELKTYLDSRFEQQDKQFDAKLDAAFTHWSQLMLTEMDIRFRETHDRLGSIDSRLKLQAGLIQSGARAMARSSEFAEPS